ncbi:MAG: hypothetical protein RLZ07_1460, partial [Pseudomonadota bacterium]
GRETKSVAAKSLWLFQNPGTSALLRWGHSLIARQGNGNAAES